MKYPDSLTFPFTPFITLRYALCALLNSGLLFEK
jgi:hypothetical protein